MGSMAKLCTVPLLADRWFSAWECQTLGPCNKFCYRPDSEIVQNIIPFLKSGWRDLIGRNRSPTRNIARYDVCTISECETYYVTFLSPMGSIELCTVPLLAEVDFLESLDFILKTTILGSEADHVRLLEGCFINMDGRENHEADLVMENSKRRSRKGRATQQVSCIGYIIIMIFNLASDHFSQGIVHEWIWSMMMNDVELLVIIYQLTWYQVNNMHYQSMKRTRTCPRGPVNIL